MAVVHTTAVRNTMADAVVDLIDTAAPGKIEMQDSDTGEVATLLFSDTAFGGAAAGIATANAISDETIATGSSDDITQAVFFDGNTLEILQCSVTNTSGGGDITLSSVAVSAGQTVSLTALTYAAAA